MFLFEHRACKQALGNVVMRSCLQFVHSLQAVQESEKHTEDDITSKEAVSRLRRSGYLHNTIGGVLVLHWSQYVPEANLCLQALTNMAFGAKLLIQAASSRSPLESR